MTIAEEIKHIDEQEKRIRFSSFTPDLAFEIGTAIRAEALRRGVAVAIDIRAFGQILFHCAMAGTAPDNERWIERKIAVVTRFHRSSFLVGRKLAAAGTTIDEKSFVSPFEFSPHGGCFPIRLTDGGVIGTATVSGLPQEEDHDLVTSVLERFVQTQQDSADKNGA
jgi:uncharacterized protein (UPF0303 family)